MAKTLKEKPAEQWLRENKAALESSNEYVEKHGLPLAQYRQFQEHLIEPSEKSGST